MPTHIVRFGLAIASMALFAIAAPIVSAQDESPKLTGLINIFEQIPQLEMLPYKSGDGGTVSEPTMAAVPPMVDLSTRFPPVRDQGYQGSCVAFAVAYALKSYQEGRDLGWDLNSPSAQFSPSYVYNQICVDPNAPDGGGSTFSDAFRVMVDQGCTTWGNMPYNGQYWAHLTQPTQAQRARAAEYKAAGWSQLPWKNIQAIKEQLAAGNPVVIGIPVYDDFYNLGLKDDVYNVRDGQDRGGHAVCIVGYHDSWWDSENQTWGAFKIINSWGYTWGYPAGHGWIGYDFIRNGYAGFAYVMTDIPTRPIPPQPRIGVDNHSSGAVLIREGSNAVSVTAYYGAEDVNRDLSGIRWNIWNSTTGYFTSSDGFVPQSGASGEVAQSFSLDSDGDWYFWTDAIDARGQYASTGDWTNGFKLTVRTVPNQTRYRIVAEHSGKVLDVAFSSTEDHAPIIQHSYHGGFNQQWTIDNAGDDTFIIRSVSSGKALDVPFESHEAGTRIIQHWYHGGPNQRWTLEDDGTGVYTIRAVHSGMVLDVDQASTDDHAPITQFHHHGGSNQRWRLEPVN